MERADFRRLRMTATPLSVVVQPGLRGPGSVNQDPSRTGITHLTWSACDTTHGMSACTAHRGASTWYQGYVAFYQLITGPELGIPGSVTVSGLYVVASLEIAIRDAEGTGLALRLHSYPADVNRQGYWAPPNMQYHVNRDYEAPQDISDILAHFTRYVDDRSPSMLEDVTLLAESFGLRGAVVRRLAEESIIELKPSINQPAIINAFCTVRFALTGLNEKSEANLVDREGRHGFVLFPLDGALATKVRHQIDLYGTGTVARHFLGKPIISGLERVLDQHARGVRARAIDVSTVVTRRTEQGIIVVADIAGYGRVLTSEYLGYVSTRDRELRSFQSRVLSALERALTATGTTQVQTAGDGFVAGYPTENEGPTVIETVMEVLHHWTETVTLIDEEINVALAEANNPSRLGSRIAVSYGRYEWGRINGLESFSPAFNGPAVVDTARLEQGLNAYIAERVRNQTMAGDEHMLAIDKRLAAVIGAKLDTLGAMGWADAGEYTLRAKERNINGVRLFQWLR